MTSSADSKNVMDIDENGDGFGKFHPSNIHPSILANKQSPGLIHPLTILTPTHLSIHPSMKGTHKTLMDGESWHHSSINPFFLHSPMQVHPSWTSLNPNTSLRFIPTPPPPPSLDPSCDIRQDSRPPFQNPICPPSVVIYKFIISRSSSPLILTLDFLFGQYLGCVQ